MNDLKVLVNSIDVSDSANDYLTDSFTIINGPIELELYKPFYQVYCDVTIPAEDTDLFLGEYWDGATYQPLQIFDQTKGLARSGWIKFYLPTDLKGATKIRLTRSSFEAACSGINIVFSDDLQLKKEMVDVVVFRPKNATSFITYHVAARDEIIQRIRNQGKIKNSLNKIEKWDILDIEEIKQAATYLALSKICFNISNGVDDKYYQQSKDYMDHFAKAFDLFFMTIDVNDDGIIDIGEKASIQFIRITRV